MVATVATVEPAEPQQLVPVVTVATLVVPELAVTVETAVTDSFRAPNRIHSELQRATAATALLVDKVGPAATPDSAELMAMVATVATLATVATVATVATQSLAQLE